MNNSLKSVNYEFLFNEPNSYTLRATGTIEATSLLIAIQSIT